MSQLQRWTVLGLVLLATGWTQPAQAIYEKLRLPLTGCRGFLNARGSVTYTNSLAETDFPDGQKLIIEIENVSLPPGTELLVYVHEVQVGTVTLDKRRGARLVLESKFREHVPRITSGSFVVLMLDDGTKVMW